MGHHHPVDAELDRIQGKEFPHVQGQEHTQAGVTGIQQFLFQDEQVAVQFQGLLLDILYLLVQAGAVLRQRRQARQAAEQQDQQ